MASKKIKERYVIGIDSSTTSTKAIAFNKAGKIVAVGQHSIPLNSPQPNYYEQNPDDWWNSTKKSLKKVTSLIDTELIDGIAIVNQRETFVPLDKNNKPLRSAIIWLDERCKDEVKPFSKKVGERKIHSISGKPADYAPVVYRLAWMKKHEKDLYKNIAMICDVHTYLSWKLTGNFTTSWASADPLGLYDLKKKEWSSEILKALNIKINQLPKTVPPGTLIGDVTKEIAKATGLKAGTPLFAGGGDGQAAGLGAKILSSDRAYLNLGTAVVLGIYGDELKINKAFRTMSSCSSNGYYYECSLRAGTFAVNWFIKDILKIDPTKNKKIFQALENEASAVDPGSEGLLHLPYLCGAMNPFWDINARAAFVGLSSSHNRGHMYRALLEGIAFEQLLALTAVEKTIGKKVRDLVVMGGGSGSSLWLQILADITGRNICIPVNKEISGLGAGMAAAVGAGWFNNFDTASAKMSGTEKILKPNLEIHKTYTKQFSVYRKIYEALKSLK